MRNVLIATMKLLFYWISKPLQ